MCTPWSSDWTIWWKWDRKPTKEQKLPESFLLVSSLTRNPENHFQTHPRIKAFLSMRSFKLQTFPFVLLLPSQILFSETPKLPPLAAKLPHIRTTPLQPHHLSVSIFKCLENTRRGNKGQMPVCNLCLDSAKHDVWIRCVEWKFLWQRDGKAGGGVTDSFYHSNRNSEAIWGTMKGHTASPEFFRNPKNLSAQWLLPPPPHQQLGII